jgi:hypothetical protein
MPLSLKSNRNTSRVWARTDLHEPQELQKKKVSFRQKGKNFSAAAQRRGQWLVCVCVYHGMSGAVFGTCSGFVHGVRRHHRGYIPQRIGPPDIRRFANHSVHIPISGANTSVEGDGGGRQEGGGEEAERELGGIAVAAARGGGGGGEGGAGGGGGDDQIKNKDKEEKEDKEGQTESDKKESHQEATDAMDEVSADRRRGGGEREWEEQVGVGEEGDEGDEGDEEREGGNGERVLEEKKVVERGEHHH